MEKDLNKVPATMMDVVMVLAVIVTEIVAALEPKSSSADNLLTDIANRIDDLGQATTNERSAALLIQVARQLIATETP